MGQGMGGDDSQAPVSIRIGSDSSTARRFYRRQLRGEEPHSQTVTIPAIEISLPQEFAPQPAA